MADSSSTITTASLGDGSKSRPRPRRLLDPDAVTGSSNGHPTGSPSARGLLSGFSPASSRSNSPFPSSRASQAGGGPPGAGTVGQFLNESLAQSWSSVSNFTNSLLSDGKLRASSPGGRSSSHVAGGGGGAAAGRGRQYLPKPTPPRTARSWGPAPPSETSGAGDIAGGSLAEREAALKAARTASVLESHDGVNGGLDVGGKHKRRNSDDVQPAMNEHEEVHVYVHWVKSSDTFVGLILRYKCREDALRRANGLWSRDSIQTRKWLAVPVDACEIRGRLCDAPSWHNDQKVDHLAPTPLDEGGSGKTSGRDGFFAPTTSGGTSNDKDAEEYPWTHVRWVKVDSIQEPIEIVRVPRQAIGYFPPRRRKSMRTYSSLSTPRQSIDLSSNPPGSAEGPGSRRQSSLGSRPQLPGTPASTRSRMGSDADKRPAWMNRPGGVGSMGKSSRAPGPDKDYFNSFTKKHIPGLNIEGPSMSVMGAQTASLGFGKDTGDLVESPFEDGRDAASTSRQGTGLDKAAAAVETWLRGALSKKPSTPMLGGFRLGSSRTWGADDGDLIELTDTASDDGHLPGGPDTAGGLLGRPVGTTGRSDGMGGTVRGRGGTSAAAKKAD